MSTELVNTGNTLPILLGTSNLEAYMRAVRSIPILTLEEEQQYVIDLQETGNIASAQKLILPHLRFVIKVANKYA